MNHHLNYGRLSKIGSVATTGIRYGLVLCLCGVAVGIVLRDPDWRAAFAWPVIRHWLCTRAVVVAVLTGLLSIITVAGFGFNSDWHTQDGAMKLLLCLLAYLIVAAVLAGLSFMATIMAQLGC